MFRKDFAGVQSETPVGNFDDSLRMSASTAATIESMKPLPDIHPYLEIGKSLQNLRRSVFDMYKEEVTKSSRSGSKSSPPSTHTTSNSTSSHIEHNYLHSENQNNRTSMFSPSSTMDPSMHTAENTQHTPVTESQYDFQHQQQQYRGDQGRHSKTRVSTPYRHTQQTYEEIGNIRKFSANELDDSAESEERSPKISGSGSRRRASKSHKSSHHEHRSGSKVSHDEKMEEGGGAGTGTGADTPLSSASPAAASSRPVNFEDSSSEDSRSGDGNSSDSPKAESAAVEVSHSIAVIVGQHEERFTK